MIKSDSFVYQRLSDGNLKDVQFLFETVFKQSITLDQLEKKYDTTYTGIKHIAFLAYEKDMPVAFYGALPQSFSNGSEYFVGVHTCDSITLPEYQRRGLHQSLAIKSYDLMKSLGVKFVYAFHSENTFHSCKKLDWKVLHTMKGFWIKTDNFPTTKVLRKVQPLSSWIEKRAQKILAPHVCPVSKFSNSNTMNGIYVHYSEAFFEYKCFSLNEVIELEGVKFWVKLSSGIMIGDINFKTEAQLMLGLDRLKKLCVKLGYNEILFQTTVGTEIEKVLSKHFTGFESWKLGYLLFDEELEIDSFRSNFGDLDTF